MACRLQQVYRELSCRASPAPPECALALGQGTEDLYIIWKRWHPAGMRINVLTHCPCDHVIWEKKKGGNADKYTLHQVYHEQEGEYAGHLRVAQRPVTVANGFMSPVVAEQTPKPEERNGEPTVPNPPEESPVVQESPSPQQVA